MGQGPSGRVCWIYVVFHGKTFVTRNLDLFNQFLWIDCPLRVQAGQPRIHSPSLGHICLKHPGAPGGCALSPGSETTGLCQEYEVRACPLVMTDRFSEGI